MSQSGLEGKKKNKNKNKTLVGKLEELLKVQFYWILLLFTELSWVKKIKKKKKSMIDYYCIYKVI